MVVTISTVSTTFSSSTGAKGSLAATCSADFLEAERLVDRVALTGAVGPGPGSKSASGAHLLLGLMRLPLLLT